MELSLINEEGCTCSNDGSKNKKKGVTNLRRLSSPSCAKISREPILNHDFAKRRTTAAKINEY